jgi:hypothetical protein
MLLVLRAELLWLRGHATVDTDRHLCCRGLIRLAASLRDGRGRSPRM